MIEENLNDLNSEPKQESENKIICPVCGCECVIEKCKVVCRSERCIYLIVYNCSEF